MWLNLLDSGSDKPKVLPIAKLIKRVYQTHSIVNPLEKLDSIARYSAALGDSF
jgi:hypothetical protein